MPTSPFPLHLPPPFLPFASLENVRRIRKAKGAAAAASKVKRGNSTRRFPLIGTGRAESDLGASLSVYVLCCVVFVRCNALMTMGVSDVGVAAIPPGKLEGVTCVFVDSLLTSYLPHIHGMATWRHISTPCYCSYYFLIPSRWFRRSGSRGYRV
ncbi:hypothetical protein F5Y06DRAFT_266833 [Hypoxylon sp. FL0890]|nr:hypothetical protein F5Y06DRAFT_266833 [Hypoxylon sp. FL0890]